MSFFSKLFGRAKTCVVCGDNIRSAGDETQFVCFACGFGGTCHANCALLASGSRCPGCARARKAALVRMPRERVDSAPVDSSQLERQQRQIAAIGESGGLDDVEVLKSITRSPSNAVLHWTANEALIQIGARLKVADPILATLTSPDFFEIKVAKAALAALSEMQEVSAVAPLMDFYFTRTAETTSGPSDTGFRSIRLAMPERDFQANFTSDVTKAVARVHGPVEAAAMIWASAQKNKGHHPDRVWSVLQSLGDSASTTLIRIVDEEPIPSKIKAIGLLTLLRDQSLSQLFADNLTKENPALSEAAANALAQLGTGGAERLIVHLSSPSWGLRKRTILALKASQCDIAAAALAAAREHEQDYDLQMFLKSP